MGKVNKSNNKLIVSKKMGKVNKSNNKLIEKIVKKKDTIDSNVIIKTNLSLNLCLFYSIYNSLKDYVSLK